MKLKRILAGVCAGLVVVVGATAVRNVGQAGPMKAAAQTVAGTKARFAFLDRQTTNNCGLQPAMVMTYPDHTLIQGSCCSAMDWPHYQQQIRGLGDYRHISVIPVDPYSIQASLAKKLFRYETSIHLTFAQNATYNRAMRMTPEKGPMLLPVLALGRISRPLSLSHRG
ncbi:MAG: hypothetical protein ACR2JC_01845 [Chloroflexota bacterium]|nr:MAG: hypothetical protein DLM70_19210 [Chloroflexota bacterium]